MLRVPGSLKTGLVGRQTAMDDNGLMLHHNAVTVSLTGMQFSNLECRYWTQPYPKNLRDA